MTSTTLEDFGRLIDTLHEGVQLIDPDFRYVYLNPVAARHGQRTAEELIGKRMVDAYPGIEQTEMFKHLVRIMADGGAHTMENEFAFPDGSIGWFEIRLTRVDQGVVVLSLDVTDRKRAEESLKVAQHFEAVGKLAAGVAHDFGNTLNIISASAELCAASAVDEEQREDLEGILSAVRSASSLISRLLAVSQRHPVTPAPIDVGDVLDDVRQLLARALEKTFELEIAAPTSPSTVLMDPSALEQGILNLVLNARDAMPSGGRIGVAPSVVNLPLGMLTRTGPLPPGTYVAIEVSDEGPGISTAELDRAFEPFFTTKGKNGTGLGLATTRGLVQQAGGRIDATSSAHGTTFKLFLPLLAERFERAYAPTPDSRQTSTRTVLVVDDHRMSLKAMRHVLEREGFVVRAAASSADALAILEEVKHDVDLLVADVVLPELNGIDLAQRARAIAPGIPTLFVSGMLVSQLSRSGMSVGSAPFLPKPFSPRSLLDAVGQAIERRLEGTTARATTPKYDD